MNYRVSLLFVAFSIAQLSSAQMDSPDLKKENQLYQLYKDYNSAPTDISSWSTATKGKSEKYEISEKDTLWEVSEVLFGDPNFWPKVWSLNAEKIENPHQIFPNQTIKFNVGTLAEPPSLEIEKTGIEPAETLTEVKVETATVAKTAPEQEDDSSDEEETDDGEEDSPAGPLDAKSKEILGLATIPAESKDRKKAGVIPLSLPKWTFARRVPKLQLEFKKLVRIPPPPEEPLKFFISNEAQMGVGKVLSGEMDQLTSAEFQYVNVQVDSGVSDKKFYAITRRGLVKDPVSGEKAYVYQLEGEVEVQDAINSSENIYRAFVPKIVIPINMGASLVAGDYPKYRSSVGEVTAGKAWVIGGEQDEDRHLLYTNSLAYLSGDGLSEGATYPIYKKQSLRVTKSFEVENPRRIGAVKVVKISGRFATGVIVDASEEIRVGDVTDPSLIPID